jgi:SAM-dependent methyltransferase
MHKLLPLARDQEQTHCPSCGSEKFYDRGIIPSASEFAGQALDTPLEGGSLYDCQNCALCYRSILHEPAFYDALYAQAKSMIWEAKIAREDQLLVSKTLQHFSKVGDVLDIGCGSGALLDMLPISFRRYGIEIGMEARELAASKGIKLVGNSFNELVKLNINFDVVLACDLIEHCTDPLKFVKDSINLLKPKGLLIISTGNADAPLWRLSGGRFWYCQFAEHLTFISPRWVELNAKGNFEIVAIKQFSYGNQSRVYKAKHAAALVGYHLMPKTYSKIMAWRRNWAGVKPYCSPLPGMGLTNDHIIIVLRRLSS